MAWTELPKYRTLHGLGHTQFEDPWFEYTKAMGAALNPAGVSWRIDLPSTSPRRWVWHLDALRARLESCARGFMRLNLSVVLRGAGPADTAIADGAHKSEIQALARLVRDSGVEVYLRLGGEVTSAWAGYTPTCFPAAWAAVRKIFEEEKALDRVRFVWTLEPHGACPFKGSELHSAWYPKDTEVDMLGLALFDRHSWVGAVDENARRSQFTENVEFLLAHAENKPWIVADSSPVYTGGLGVSFVRGLWFDPLLRLIDKCLPEAVFVTPVDWVDSPVLTDKAFGNARFYAQTDVREWWADTLTTLRPRIDGIAGFVHADEYRTLVEQPPAPAADAKS